MMHKSNFDRDFDYPSGPNHSDILPREFLLYYHVAVALILPLDVQEVTQAISINSIHDPIVSLGPRTDAVLDLYDLDDTFILRLRNLVTTVRSSRWEATLQSSPWGLSFAQAVTLSKALLQDIRSTNNVTRPYEVSALLHRPGVAHVHFQKCHQPALLFFHKDILLPDYLGSFGILCYFPLSPRVIIPL